LTKIEAVGNVDMKEKDMTATCERAVFYETEERIELEGSEDSPAVVDDGKNRMEAPAITYFRREDRLEASRGVSGHVTIEAKEGETEGQGDKGTEEQEER
jgi:lipopolysaccharide export system protein LptA